LYLQTEKVKVDDKTYEIPVAQSPFCELGYFGMVDGFPLEGMHSLYMLLCGEFLDVIINFLQTAVRGSDRVERLSQRITLCHPLVPSEFTRKVSPVSNLTDWKATEYRQFFLYQASALLEDLVEDDDPAMDHRNVAGQHDEPVHNENAPTLLTLIQTLQTFMYLICGTDPTPVPERDLNLADRIAVYWISWFIRRFKLEGWKPSTHWILHLVRDCRVIGSHLDEISVFRFENEMRYIRPLINSGYNKLEQLRNRIYEREKFVFNRDNDGNIIRREDGDLAVGVWDRGLLENKEIPAFLLEVAKVQNGKREGDKDVKRIRFQDFLLSNTHLKDRFCLIHDPMREHLLESRDDGTTRQCAKPWSYLRIVRVDDVVKCRVSGEATIIGTVFEKVEPFFKEPEDSRIHHVYAFGGAKETQLPFPISCVVGKLYVIPRFSKFPKGVDHKQFVANNFANVEDWVGVGLQHTKAVGFSTMY
jgi:hypothetical protein